MIIIIKRKVATMSANSGLLARYATPKAGRSVTLRAPFVRCLVCYR